MRTANPEIVTFTAASSLKDLAYRACPVVETAVNGISGSSVEFAALVA
jgi:hypothetical protein